MKAVLVFFFLAVSLFSQPNIEVSPSLNKLQEFKVEIFEDTSAKLSFEDIQKLDSFEESTNNISQGYTSSAFWIRFSLENISDDKLVRFVKFKDAYLDKIEFYALSKDNTYSADKKGIAFFKADQENKLIKPSFRFELGEREKKTLYIKMASKYPVFTTFSIYDKEALNEYIYSIDIFYALYFGAVIALILYNLFIFIYSRDIAYLFYILFGTSFVTWQLILNGYYPLNSFNSTFSFYAFSSSIPFSMAFLFYFSRFILETKKYFAKIDKFLLSIGTVYLILGFISFKYTNFSFTIMNSFTSITLPLLLYVGYVSYKAGNKIAIYYLSAQFFFLSGATLFSLSAYGILDYSETNRHTMIIGSFIEMTLFSLALAYRIKKLEYEKLIIIEKANVELEEKVKERTSELVEYQEKLKELANKDHLSNLYNRRYLNEFSKNLINIVKREKNVLSVVLFDLDFFKKINDEYGHSVGDEVIKKFASILLREVRASDLVFRIGGEEFLIILLKTDTDGAYTIANKIREVCSKEKIELDNGETVCFSVSGGVSTLLSEDKDIYDTIKRADKLLYEAKKSGRDKILKFTIGD